MCGVVGFTTVGAPQADHALAFWALMRQSRIRGTHAYGFTAAGPYGARVTARELDLGALYARWEALPFRVTAAIGHTRFCTGESYLDPADNQPVVVDGYALCYNGVIDMSPAAEWPARYGRAFHTANDAEIAAAALADGGGGLGLLLRNPAVTFAGAWLTPEGMLACARNAGRPLWRVEWYGAIFLASTADILFRAGLPPGHLVAPV